jgi:hypothetical protein
LKADGKIFMTQRAAFLEEEQKNQISAFGVSQQPA